MFSSYMVTTPIRRLSRPFLRFLEIEASSGVILVCCTVLALLLANSPWASSYQSIWNTSISLGIGDFHHQESLKHWINDGLMSIFFFVIGLEIKREMTHGEFRNLRAALLPIIAALGGMIVPAALYVLILFGQSGVEGWGIPMATDIAFVVGVLALFGKRVPRALKIFLLSLAIADDIGAVTVIALFYTADISVFALGLGALGFLTIAALNRLGVRQIPVYTLVGFFIWLAFLFSGVHPTVAFVLLSLLTPANAWVGDATFIEALTFWLKGRKANSPKITHDAHQINGLMYLARESISPLERLEVALHPWVAFFIMPIFALANAGVSISIGAMNSRIFLGVAVGLFLGKVVGIVLFSWIAVRFCGCRLPAGMNWIVLLGSGFLGGIGFTMSIFITGLALEGPQFIEGIFGTLFGSVLSAIFGISILHFSLNAKTRSAEH